MLDVELCRFGRMVRRVLMMPVGSVRVMRGGLMVACLMMLGCFAVVAGRMLVVFGRLAVMLCSLL